MPASIAASSAGAKRSTTLPPPARIACCTAGPSTTRSRRQRGRHASTARGVEQVEEVERESPLRAPSSAALLPESRAPGSARERMRAGEPLHAVADAFRRSRSGNRARSPGRWRPAASSGAVVVDLAPVPAAHDREAQHQRREHEGGSGAQATRAFGEPHRPAPAPGPAIRRGLLAPTPPRSGPPLRTRGSAHSAGTCAPGSCATRPAGARGLVALAGGGPHFRCWRPRPRPGSTPARPPASAQRSGTALGCAPGSGRESASARCSCAVRARCQARCSRRAGSPPRARAAAAYRAGRKTAA